MIEDKFKSVRASTREATHNAKDWVRSKTGILLITLQDAILHRLQTPNMTSF